MLNIRDRAYVSSDDIESTGIGDCQFLIYAIMIE